MRAASRREIALVGCLAIVDAEDGRKEMGEANGVIRALRHGLLYVNVHSEHFPDGELGGQLD